MKRIITGAIVFALLLGSSIAAIAADPAYILRDDGLYVLQPDALSLVKVAFVDQRTGAPPPTPGPGPTPQPPGDTVTSRVKEAAVKADDLTTAQLLAIVYREVAKKPNGTRAQYLDAIKQGTDSVLNITGTANRWTQARKTIGDIITEQEAAGPVNYPDLLNKIAAGLEQAAAGQPALDPALLALIVKIIIEIISRLFGL